MQANAGARLLFCILLTVPASSQTAAPVSSQLGELPGIMLPISFTMAGPNEMAIAPQQQGGYYRPNNVPPAPHGAPCGHEDSGVCPVDVPIPPGATGERLYQLGRQQDQRHLAEAVAYLTASANLGYGPAEGALGTAYVMGGNGVRHDAVKGVHLLELAAAQAERAFGGAVAQVGGCGQIRDGLREMALVLLSAELVQLLARGAGRNRDVHGTDAAILVAAGCAMGRGRDVVRTIVSTLLLRRDGHLVRASHRERYRQHNPRQLPKLTGGRSRCLAGSGNGKQNTEEKQRTGISLHG
jgi:hypothetical protein